MIISLARIIMLTWFALALIAWTVDIDSNQIESSENIYTTFVEFPLWAIRIRRAWSFTRVTTY